MKATWTGITLCCLVIYFGIVHSLGNPWLLLNVHATILVIGGTIAIAFLTYSWDRLIQVMDFVVFGFLFRLKKKEHVVAQELIAKIDMHFGYPPVFDIGAKPYPFLLDAFHVLHRKDLSLQQVHRTLTSRRDAIKRQYVEDAKILNNIAKYPPHLGLLGAASGMIEMMSGLGSSGVSSIGAAMAVALSATLWGVGLNNFVFLPLSDNSMKAAADEIYLRDIIIECCLMIKRGEDYESVIETCLNKLSMVDRSRIRAEYNYENRRQPNIRVV